MLKVITFVIALFVSTTSSFAQQHLFFRQVVGNWEVFGHKGSDTLNPACVINRDWQDGSSVQVIYDLKDGELYLRIKNTQWNIGDPVGNYGDTANTSPAQMIFVGNSNTNNSNVIYSLVSKNIINIRHLKPVVFLKDFASQSKFQLVMPGTITNVSFDLQQSNSAVELLVACIDVSTNVKKNSAPVEKKPEQGA